MKNNRDNIYTSEVGELYTEYSFSAEFDISIIISVKSYGFSGGHEFCINKEVTRERIKELENMHFSLLGECTMNDSDSDSDSYIKLSFIGNELTVSGQLGGSYNSNFIKFSFTADQTLLKLLSDTLKGYVS